jgi:hypothetical protein
VSIGKTMQDPKKPRESNESLDADLLRDEVVRRMANTPPKPREESMPPKKARAKPKRKVKI